MTAKEIYKKVYDWLPPWDRCEDIPKQEQIEYIQERIEAGILEVYEKMINDINVMAENGDDTTAILNELLECDNEQLDIYKETFLV